MDYYWDKILNIFIKEIRMMMLCVCLVVIPATQGKENLYFFLLTNEIIKNYSNHFSKSKTYLYKIFYSK